MNLYEYLMSKSNNTTRAANEAKEAYKRFQAYARSSPVRDYYDPFVFAFCGHGSQAFTFYPDQIVKNRQGELAIVTGWKDTSSHGWLVRVKTAKGEYDSLAEELAPAAFPEGLVEILRGKVHGKVDEAFKED